MNLSATSSVCGEKVMSVLGTLAEEKEKVLLAIGDFWKMAFFTPFFHANSKTSA